MTRSKGTVTWPWKFEILPFSKSICSAIFNGSWQVTVYLLRSSVCFISCVGRNGQSRALELRRRLEACFQAVILRLLTDGEPARRRHSAWSESTRATPWPPVRGPQLPTVYCTFSQGRWNDTNYAQQLVHRKPSICERNRNCWHLWVHAQKLGAHEV